MELHAIEVDMFVCPSSTNQVFGHHSRVLWKYRSGTNGPGSAIATVVLAAPDVEIYSDGKKDRLVVCCCTKEDCNKEIIDEFCVVVAGMQP
jgi:hypothetical protein